MRTLQGSSQLRLRCRDSAQGAVGHDGLHVPGCGDQEGCSAGAQKTPSPQIKEAGEMSYQKAGARERRSSRLQVLLNKGKVSGCSKESRLAMGAKFAERKPVRRQFL